jgi:hypothetical protein
LLEHDTVGTGDPVCAMSSREDLYRRPTRTMEKHLAYSRRRHVTPITVNDHDSAGACRR